MAWSSNLLRLFIRFAGIALLSWLAADSPQWWAKVPLLPGTTHEKDKSTRDPAKRVGPPDRRRRGLPLQPGRTIEFTTDEGAWVSLDVFPDGKMIVFELLGDLYTVPIAGGDAKALTGGLPFDSQPRCSPNGKLIAFLSDRDGADYSSWTDGGKTITWAIGSSFFRLSFDSIVFEPLKADEDEKEGDKADGEKKEQKPKSVLDQIWPEPKPLPRLW